MIDWSQTLPDIAFRAVPLFALSVAANVALFAYCFRHPVATIGSPLLVLGARLLFFMTGVPLTMIPIMWSLVWLVHTAELPVSWFDNYFAGGVVAIVSVWLLNLLHQVTANAVRWKMGLPMQPIALVNSNIDWLGRPRRKPRRGGHKRSRSPKPQDPTPFPAEEG